MREIEFRGKRIDNGKWVCGGYFEKMLAYKKNNQSMQPVIVFDHCNTFDVIPETIGQYTGLKDKNGTKIFEGDIVKADDNIYSVAYQDDYAQFMFCSEKEDITALNLYSIEVIGNIYDNPELLEVKDED